MTLLSSDLTPNLFVIGASKAGSSALHAYLQVHPDICMSREKEPCFFVDQTELTEAWPIMARQPCSHDWNAYLDLWSDCGATARYRGEGSVYYSQTPHRSGVPARIKAACPDARFIYTVRDPVQRAVGHYWQRFKEFQEPLDIDRAVRENAIYRDTSDYALQLRAYLDHFDISRIHIVVAEDLRRERRRVMDEVFQFLDLPSYDFSAEELTERHKSPATSRRQRFPLVSRARDSAAWAMLRRMLPRQTVAALRKAATVQFDKSDVDESQARAWLSDYLAPKKKEFEALIDRTIIAWDGL